MIVILSMVFFIVEIMIVHTRILEYMAEHNRRSTRLINIDNMLSLMVVACIPVFNAAVGIYLILLVYDEDFMRENF